MAIKYGELKKRILLKIDEYEADADGMTSDEDIITRMPDVVNEAIRFVFYGKSHNKTWNVKQGAPINALEKGQNDSDYQPLYGEHRTDDISFEADGVCCYFFEVDDTADVYVYYFDTETNDWVSLKTEALTTQTDFYDFDESLSFSETHEWTLEFDSKSYDLDKITVTSSSDVYTMKYIRDEGFGVCDFVSSPTLSSEASGDFVFVSNNGSFTGVQIENVNTGTYTWTPSPVFTETLLYEFAFESNSNNYYFARIDYDEDNEKYTLVYGDGSDETSVWDSSDGWADSAYKTIVTEDDIDERLDDFITATTEWRIYYLNGNNKTEVYNATSGWSDNAYKVLNTAGSVPDSLSDYITMRTSITVWDSTNGWIDSAYKRLHITNSDDIPDALLMLLSRESVDEYVPTPTAAHKNEQPYSEFVGYKGKISNTPVKARIVFSGSYYYKYKNVCLHNVAYETDEKVPEYSGYREHIIPKNCYQIVQAYKVRNNERKNVSYYTEGNKLYLPDEEGTVFLVSKFFPDPVTEDTPDDYVIDIPIDNEWIVVNKASQIFMLEGDASEFLAEEEQGMQMLESESERGRSHAPKVVRLL